MPFVFSAYLARKADIFRHFLMRLCAMSPRLRRQQRPPFLVVPCRRTGVLPYKATRNFRCLKIFFLLPSRFSARRCEKRAYTVPR